jgi:hypothetical protein
MSNQVDLNALFADVLEPLRRRPRHAYIKNPHPKARVPDYTQLPFDADRFRWLVSKRFDEAVLRRGVGCTTIDEWRAWIDREIALEKPP